MLTMHLSRRTTSQETYMVTICTFIKSNMVATPHFCLEIKWSFQGFWVISWSTGLIPTKPGSGFCSGTTSSFREPSPASRLDAQQLDPAPVGLLHCIQSLSFKKNPKSVWRQRSSSQLLRASGQSRGFQVTLQFSDRTSVQGAEVKVKSSVCDVEVSSLFNEVYNLENRGYNW